MRLKLALTIYRIIALIKKAIVPRKETPAIHKKTNQSNLVDSFVDSFVAISDSSPQDLLFL